MAVPPAAYAAALKAYGPSVAAEPFTPAREMLSHSENFEAAKRDMRLTPQEQFLYQQHLQNLYSNPVLHQNGDVSTLYQTVAPNGNGGFANIPTVWDGKIVPEDIARANAARVGMDKWPAYATPDAADARYMQMHDYMGQDVGDFRGVR